MYLVVIDWYLVSACAWPMAGTQKVAQMLKTNRGSYLATKALFVCLPMGEQGETTSRIAKRSIPEVRNIKTSPTYLEKA